MIQNISAIISERNRDMNNDCEHLCSLNQNYFNKKLIGALLIIRILLVDLKLYFLTILIPLLPQNRGHGLICILYSYKNVFLVLRHGHV